MDCGFGLFCKIFDDFEALLYISKAFTLWESSALTTRPLLPMAPKGGKGGGNDVRGLVQGTKFELE